VREKNARVVYQDNVTVVTDSTERWQLGFCVR
jgi:hypothetical protein